ncbi:MAG: tetratricopeptide repeat protein, partial [Bacteroidota bacterium]
MAARSSSVSKTVKKAQTGGKDASKPNPRLSPALAALLKRADQARTQFKYKEAIDLYTEAIDSGKLDPAREFDAREGRRSTMMWMLPLEIWQPDLKRMAILARKLKDPARRARVLIGQVQAADPREAETAVARGRRAVSIARKLKDPILTAEGLLTLGYALFMNNEIEAAAGMFRQSEEIFRARGHRMLLGRSLLFLGFMQERLGDPEAAVAYREQALEVFRSLGDTAGEANALTSLSVVTSDLARQLDLANRSLQITRVIDRSVSSSLSSMNYNNLCVTYWNLGLQRRARDLGEMAVSMQRTSNA